MRYEKFNAKTVRLAMTAYDTGEVCMCGHLLKAHISTQSSCLYGTKNKGNRCSCKHYTEAETRD